MFLVITRLGSNFNKRYYLGFDWGAFPNRKEEQKNHPKYPWYKRYRIKFYGRYF